MVVINLNVKVTMREDEFTCFEDIVAFLSANHNSPIDLIYESDTQITDIIKIEIIKKD